MSPASTVAVTGQLADGSAATSEGLAVSGRRRISAPLHARPGRHAYCSAPRGNARAHPRAFRPARSGHAEYGCRAYHSSRSWWSVSAGHE